MKDIRWSVVIFIDILIIFPILLFLIERPKERASIDVIKLFSTWKNLEFSENFFLFLKIRDRTLSNMNNFWNFIFKLKFCLSEKLVFNFFL